jgi:hypothetical protein
VGVDKPRRKSKLTPDNVIRDQVAEMRHTDDWSQARASHMLGLYEWMHEQVYGVLPAELTGKGKPVADERMKAIGAIVRMLANEFDGSITGMVDYIRWISRRELRTEKWAKESNVQRGRLSWYKVFGLRSLYSDFLVDRKRGEK